MPAKESQKWLRALHELEARVGLVQAGICWLGTSGTSGKSKWVAISKAAILESARGVNQHLQSHSSDRWLHVLPDFHVGGLGIWARSGLSGASVTDLGARWRKWDAQDFAECAEREKATLSALVPTQVFDLVRAGLRAPRWLRAIVVGGGALSDKVYGEARRLGWPILPSYGLTECGSQVATASGDSPVLRILPHVEIRTNPEGFLELKSAALLTGYALETASGLEFHDPKLLGWLTTEDQGVVGEGWIQVAGRAGSFVKMSGESVDFARLEKIFEELRLELQVTVDALLIAVPNERLGFVTQLIWARADSGDGEEGENAKLAIPVALVALVARFNQGVLPFEKIFKVCRLEAIPRSALGKPLKIEILKNLSLVPD